MQQIKINLLLTIGFVFLLIVSLYNQFYSESEDEISLNLPEQGGIKNYSYKGSTYTSEKNGFIYKKEHSEINKDGKITIKDFESVTNPNKKNWIFFFLLYSNIFLYKYESVYQNPNYWNMDIQNQMTYIIIYFLFNLNLSNAENILPLTQETLDIPENIDENDPAFIDFFNAFFGVFFYYYLVIFIALFSNYPCQSKL